MARSAAALIAIFLVGGCLLMMIRPQVATLFTTPTLPVGVRIGLDPAVPPFAMLVEGNIGGIDHKILMEALSRLGVQPTFTAISSDGLADALLTGQVDVIASALVVETRFGDRIRYTQSYFNNGLVLVSTAGNPINGWRALAGRRLALELGSEANAHASRWLRRIEPFAILPYELPRYALDSLAVGDADAALVDTLTLMQYQRPEWQAVRVTETPFAFAVRPQDAYLAEQLDSVLDAMQQDGTMDAILTTLLKTTG